MKKKHLSISLLCITVGLFLIGSSSVAKADIAYLGYQNGQFATIDLTTGVVTNINPFSINPAGFGVIGSTLYTANYSGQNLYTVNTTTGALTLVGTGAGISYHDFGSTPTGLYEADGNGSLYSINSSNGAATLVGAMTGVTFSSYRALSTNSSTLYYASNNTLYALASNGAATSIGSFGSTPVVMTALMMENGTFYGADEYGNFYTINTSTGLATLDSSIPNVGGAVWALAPILSSTPVPEPATMLLLGLGLVGIAGVRRKFRN